MQGITVKQSFESLGKSLLIPPYPFLTTKQSFTTLRNVISSLFQTSFPFPILDNTEDVSSSDLLKQGIELAMCGETRFGRETVYHTSYSSAAMVALNCLLIVPNILVKVARFIINLVEATFYALKSVTEKDPKKSLIAKQLAIWKAGQTIGDLLGIPAEIIRLIYTSYKYIRGIFDTQFVNQKETYTNVGTQGRDSAPAYIRYLGFAPPIEFHRDAPDD